MYFFLFIHIRGSQKLIKLKKYNLQNRNYNRFSLQLQRYCVTYEFLIPFKNASNIIFFCSIYALPVHTAVYRHKVLGTSISRKSRDRFSNNFSFYFFFLFDSFARFLRHGKGLEKLLIERYIFYKFSNDFLLKNRPIIFK